MLGKDKQALLVIRKIVQIIQARNTAKHWGNVAKHVAFAQCWWIWAFWMAGWTASFSARWIFGGPHTLLQNSPIFHSISWLATCKSWCWEQGTALYTNIVMKESMLCCLCSNIFCRGAERLFVWNTGKRLVFLPS